RGSGRLRGARGGGDDEGGRGDHAPGRGPGDHRWILPCPGVRGATEGRLVSSSAVACPSGRRSAPRKRVRCKPPWVQIPPLPLARAGPVEGPALVRGSPVVPDGQLEQLWRV